MGGWLSSVIPFRLRGEEEMTMEFLFEFIKEVLKGITRAISAHFFQKTFLNKEKTTQSRSERVVFERKNNFQLTTTTRTVEAARGKSSQLFSLFLSISILTEHYSKFKFKKYTIRCQRINTGYLHNSKLEYDGDCCYPSRGDDT